ncbi:hypothetical protein KJ810_00280 [Patescibacteria group bacterium]|nr:hypothetical protein [Patescibacteria group bacterium]MBU2235842.1 hypothetical protein [Patescibacteria group bacterium]
MKSASKNVFVMTGIIAVIVIGFVAILWILGVGSFDELKNSLFKTIGVVVVLAAVALAITSIIGLTKKHEHPSEK